MSEAQKARAPAHLSVIPLLVDLGLLVEGNPVALAQLAPLRRHLLRPVGNPRDLLALEA